LLGQLFVVAPTLWLQFVVRVTLCYCYCHYYYYYKNFTVFVWGFRRERELNRDFSWFQTFAVFWVFYSFFWENPRRLIYICLRFGTLCSIFIGDVTRKITTNRNCLPLAI
jgi:hypothetical protein